MAQAECAMRKVTLKSESGLEVKYPRTAQAGCSMRKFASRSESGLEVEQPCMAQAGCLMRESALRSEPGARGEIVPQGSGRTLWVKGRYEVRIGCCG